ncbi:hypothetical protein M427DRAFT_41437 [Gonapodya prolifera JEL478]|uniref:Uncharacterized protein n=1 Tax=Gonapodya prolifera (strain JEL478) TaxID=1344416 RepID=A0A139ATP1_GONPJ|nr:hypothetical protein M427DRAFT_41437 [Gonapodya prolifera JEL478]|eukprot:KXS20091.1 hypothetical protein M427DRAFT_41437 [Gonapodya prolifera JEL478]
MGSKAPANSGGKGGRKPIDDDDEPPGLMASDESDGSMPELLENSDSDDGYRPSKSTKANSNAKSSAKQAPPTAAASANKSNARPATTPSASAKPATAQKPAAAPAKATTSTPAKPQSAPANAKAAPKPSPKPVPKPLSDDDDDIPALVSSGDESTDPKAGTAPKGKTAQSSAKPSSQTNSQPPKSTSSGRPQAAPERRSASPESSLSTDDDMPALAPARRGKALPLPSLPPTTTRSEWTPDNTPCVACEKLGHLIQNCPTAKFAYPSSRQQSVAHSRPCFCDSCLLAALNAPIMSPEYEALGLKAYIPQIKEIVSRRSQSDSGRSIPFPITSGTSYKLNSAQSSIDPDGTTFSPDSRGVRQLSLHFADMIRDAFDKSGDFEKTLRKVRDAEAERERVVQARLEAKKRAAKNGTKKEDVAQEKVQKHYYLEMGRKAFRLAPKQASQTTPEDSSAPASPPPLTRSSSNSGIPRPISKEDRDEAERFKNEGNEALRRERFAEAIELYTLAIQKDPTNVVYWTGAVTVMSKLIHGIADATKAIELDRSYSKAWFRRGSAYKQMGKWKEAHQDFQTCKNLDPKDSKTVELVKECETNMRKANFEKAISADDDSAAAPGRSLVAPSALKQRTSQWLARTKGTADGVDWGKTYTLALFAARTVAALVNEAPAQYVDGLQNMEERIFRMIVKWLQWRSFKVFKTEGAPAIREMLSNLKTYELMKEQEDFYRTLFATDRGHPFLSDPRLNLINVFDPVQQPYLHRTTPDAEEAQIPVLFPQPRLPRSGLATVERLEDFKCNFSVFSDKLLEKLDWRNVFAAGGSVAACLSPQPANGIPIWRTRAGGSTSPAHIHVDSDIDLFLYDLTPAEATAKVKKIARLVLGTADAKKLNDHEEPSFLVRTQHAVTFVCPYPLRRIQIVLRIYKSPAEVLMGFDVDACCAGYDGDTVWILPRYRLFKYSRRGFSVAVPGFERDRVDDAVLDPRKQRKDGGVVDRDKGLAVLVKLEASVEEYANGGGRRPEDPDEQIHQLLNTKGQTPVAPFEEVSDYDNIKIPQGEKWSMSRIKRHIERFLVNANCNERKEVQEIPQSEEVQPLLHGAPDGVLSGTIRNVGPRPSKDGDVPYVKIVPPGEMWMTQNPGTQLTGSFNPVTEPVEKWYASAYRLK